MEDPFKIEVHSSLEKQHLRELQNLQIPGSGEKVFGNIPELELFANQLDAIESSDTDAELNNNLKQEIEKFPPKGRLKIRGPENPIFSVVAWEAKLKPKDYPRQTRLDQSKKLAIIYFPMAKLNNPNRTMLGRLGDLINLNHTLKSLILDAHGKRMRDQRQDSPLFVLQLLHSDLLFLNHLLNTKVISDNESAQEVIKQSADKYHERIHISVDKYAGSPIHTVMMKIAKESLSLYRKIRNT